MGNRLQPRHGADHGEDQALLIRAARDLERSLWRNWKILLALTLVMTAFSVVDQIPSAKEWMDGMWPWPNTGIIVRAGIGAVLIAMAVTMTLQQRLSFRMRDRLQNTLSAADLQLQISLSRLTGILELTRSVSEAAEPQDVYDRLVKAAQRTFDCDQVSLMLTSGTPDELEVSAALGHENLDTVLRQRITIGKGIAGWVAESRKPTLLGKSLEIRGKYGVQYEGTPLTAAMVVPIVAQNELVGVLNVSSRSDETTYTEEDLQALLLFAGQAAIAIAHARTGIVIQAPPTPVESMAPNPFMESVSTTREEASQVDSRPLWERMFDDLAA